MKLQMLLSILILVTTQLTHAADGAITTMPGESLFQTLKRNFDTASDLIDIKQVPTVQEVNAGTKTPLHFIFPAVEENTSARDLQISGFMLIKSTTRGVPAKGPLVPGTPDFVQPLFTSCDAGYSESNVMIGGSRLTPCWQISDVTQNSGPEAPKVIMTIQPKQITQNAGDFLVIYRKAGAYIFAKLQSKSDQKISYSYIW